ncbi:MAG TPA: SDR family oxidoreductase [Geminicoccaceae bacterium]|nr:SDR family oxidoreductase [Geminicoccaceae bacterium]
MAADDPILRPGAVALVTGAGSGIGAAIARMLAARGARVICTGRDRERLERATAEIGGRAFPLQLDVTDGPAVAALPERLPEELRAIDVLVNNAGHDVGGRRRFDQGDVGDWAAILETNVTGMVRVCHAVIPGMLARGRGHVVNLGSVAGLRVLRDGSVYHASKYAVRALTEALRRDYADTPLRITEILPGLTRTGFAEARYRGDRATAEGYYAGFPQTMAPEDVARCVLFALEQPASVTIAQVVVVPTREA